VRAAIINSFGDVPAVGEYPEPAARPGQAVVDVTLAGLNPVDRLRAEGYEYLSANPPFVAGREGVGRLNGQRVYFNEAIEPYGSFAEQALVSADQLLTVPAGLTDEQAIPLGIAGLTAWGALTCSGRLAEGDRVLVTGATGMVGQVAVQAAKLLGAGYVVAAGRHVQTLESLRERGADEIVVLTEDPGPAVAGGAGGGVGVVIDNVFGKPFTAALNATAPGARVVVVGLTAGSQVNLEFFSVYLREVTGFALHRVPVAVRQAALDEMAEHAMAGRLRVDTRRYALDDVASAWSELLGSAHRKLLIAP
jgi:NADPH:quinone reductase-like Zn-dependent oxidoreductase